MNVLTAIGRLGRDAELKSTPSGTSIWSASVAVNYGYGDNKGTIWVTIVAFGKRADGLGRLSLQKGTMVGFSGELRVREYSKNDGSKGYAVECVVNDVTLTGSNSHQTTQANAGYSQNTPQQQQAPSNNFDDDIPF